MGVSVDFNLGDVSFAAKQRLMKGINKALKFRKPFIEEISPTDTREYIEAHKIREAEMVGNNVEGSNFNDSEHAFGVEFGFSSSPLTPGNRPVNWHKGPPRNESTKIYNGIGARVMERVTNDTNLRNQVLLIIAEAVIEG